MNVKLEIFRYRVVSCEIVRRVVNSPNKNDDVFFFQLSKPGTGVKTPAKQNGMNST